jgi:hypothetical protein
MKITKQRLKRIIAEEINRLITEQSDAQDSSLAGDQDPEVQLNPDAKRDTQQTATAVQTHSTAQVTALKDFKDKNPNLDHSKIDQAIQALQQVSTNIGSSLSSAINEADDEELLEIIRKLSSGDYRVYSKKKNPKTGERRNLGTYSSKSAAKDREQDINFFKTQE